MNVISQAADWFRRSRRLLATCAVGAFVSVLAFHVIFGPNGAIVYQQKRTEYKSLDAEIKSLQAENDKLNQRIKALKTDPKTIEKEAREQLRYARPGEVIYTLPAERPPVPMSSAKK